MGISLNQIAGMSGAELAAYIADVKGFIEGYQNTIGCIRSTLANPQFVEHSVAAAREMIAKHQAHIDNLLDQQENGFERIATYEARIREREQELALLFNASSIFKIAELAAQLEETLGSAKMDIVNKMAAEQQSLT